MFGSVILRQTRASGSSWSLFLCFVFITFIWLNAVSHSHDVGNATSKDNAFLLKLGYLCIHPIQNSVIAMRSKFIFRAESDCKSISSSLKRKSSSDIRFRELSRKGNLIQSLSFNLEISSSKYWEIRHFSIFKCSVITELKEHCKFWDLRNWSKNWKWFNWHCSTLRCHRSSFPENPSSLSFSSNNLLSVSYTQQRAHETHRSIS